MEKTFIQKQVRYAVEQFFTFSINNDMHLATIFNLKLEFDRADDFSDSCITISKLIDDKFEEIKYFDIQEYAGNELDLVTTPWVDKFIDDITDFVMQHIEEHIQ